MGAWVGVVQTEKGRERKKKRQHLLLPFGEPAAGGGTKQ